MCTGAESYEYGEAMKDEERAGESGDGDSYIISLLLVEFRTTLTVISKPYLVEESRLWFFTCKNPRLSHDLTPLSLSCILSAIESAVMATLDSSANENVESIILISQDVSSCRNGSALAQPYEYTTGNLSMVYGKHSYMRRDYSRF